MHGFWASDGSVALRCTGLALQKVAASGEEVPALAALKTDLDGKLPALREFFTKLHNAAVKHSIHPCLDVLSSIPLLPQSSPFRDDGSAAVVMSIARHEGVGFSADFQSRTGTPAPRTPSGPAALAAEAIDDDDDDDDEIAESDLAPYGDAGAEPDAEEFETVEDDGGLGDILQSIGSDAKGAGMDVHKGVKALMEQPANLKCSECMTPKPKWASINLGVLFCIRCSGLHRRLGTHITQVRSLTLDTWQPGWVLRCLKIGNARAAAYWEARMPPDVRPNAASSMEDVEAFLRKKYEQRSWTAPGPSPDEVLSSGGSLSTTVMRPKKQQHRPPKAPSSAPPSVTPQQALQHATVPPQARTQSNTPLQKKAPPSAVSTPQDDHDPFTHNTGEDPFGFDPFGESGSTGPAPVTTDVSGSTSPQLLSVEPLKSPSAADEFDPFAEPSPNRRAAPARAEPSFTAAAFGSSWGVPVQAVHPAASAAAAISHMTLQAPPPIPQRGYAPHPAQPSVATVWPVGVVVEFPDGSTPVQPAAVARSPVLPPHHPPSTSSFVSSSAGVPSFASPVAAGSALPPAS